MQPVEASNAVDSLPCEVVRAPLVLRPTLEVLDWVDSATQRLLRALVELAFNDTFDQDFALAVRNSLLWFLRDFLPSTATASSPCSGMALARSLRTRECPLEVGCSVFHESWIQWNFLEWGGVLNGLYHLLAWEEEDGGVRFLPTVPDAAEEQLRAAGHITENLDCLFLRLRSSVELFAAAAARRTTTTESAAVAARKRIRTSAPLLPRKIQCGDDRCRNKGRNQQVCFCCRSYDQGRAAMAGDGGRNVQD